MNSLIVADPFGSAVNDSAASVGAQDGKGEGEEAMPVYELYSQRRRREIGKDTDIVQYDEIPKKLRQQFFFVLTDLFGPVRDTDSQYWFEGIVAQLRREFGVQYLGGHSQIYPGEELHSFLIKCSDSEALDAIDLILAIATASFNKNPGSSASLKISQATDELNERFRAAGIGYYFQNGSIVRVDSQFLHADAVIPTLTVLSEPAFSAANTEFRRAHEHWRAGRLQEVLVDCLKSFESTIKIIASERGWNVPSRATASQLVQLLFDNNFLPAFYQTQIGGLRSLLESGIPTPRNRVAGHGGGTALPQVPVELVRYVLHQTAATILYLVDTHRAAT